MTEIRKHRIYLLILLLLLLPLISPLLNSILKLNENFLFNNGQDKINIPKSSGFWVMGPLHIKDTGGGGDYTWTEAVLQDWCSGAGSLNNPYLLENITINAGGNDYAIQIENSNNKHFIIRNCTVMNSGSGIYDAGIKFMSTSNGTIEDNKCLDNPSSGIQFQTNCKYNTIHDNLFYNNTFGISFETDCNFNTVTDNTITNCPKGITIWSSSNLNITGNWIINNFENKHDGIYIWDGDHIFISNNVVANYSDNLGIFLDNCNESTVINNHVFNNHHGIYNRGKNNYIASNLLDNNVYGLVAQQSFHSIFFNNTIIENERGIYVDRGTNTFYMNYLDNKLVNVYEDTTQLNNWSYDSTGNYWSDYAGVDLNDDGIGDSPYLIPGRANSKDNYPIWDDGENVLPTITLNSPIGGTIFGSDAPEFNLTIYDTHLHDAWYTIGSSVTLHSFSPSNGINIIPIDESSWDALPEGNITVTFFVNDTIGNNQTIQVIINKNLSLNDPDPAIPFGYYYIVFLVIGILVLLLVQKKRGKYKFKINF